MDRFISIAIVLLVCLSCLSQRRSTISSVNINISIPTIEQEATSIWRTINDISFLKQQGYDVSLPTGELIDSLLTKSKDGTFGGDDFPRIYHYLETEVYQEDNYQAALQKVLAEEQLINQLAQSVADSRKKWNWDLKIYDRYTVTFTLYGTGGSYDPDNGTIVLFTTTDGQFKRYRSPVNTIIHEFVHLGVEKSLVQRYQLPHPVKEQLVDEFVYQMFKEQLPDYRIQKLGSNQIDQLISSKDDFINLHEKLSTLKFE